MHKILIFALLASPAAFADQVTQVFDNQLKGIEGDVLSLAEAMPAGKYDFAPTNGTFKGVRTFAMQVKHVATIMYMLSSALTGEKPPVDIGAGENGPDSLKTKDQIVAYFKGSLAYAHKAVATVNAKSELEMVKSPFGAGTMSRLDIVSTFASHTNDHYGQMVVYGRMNGVIPPASQR